MDLLRQAFDLVVHLDTHLQQILATFGGWTYVLLFLIIFCETGLVITPFLPGDSLLFACGAFAASGALELEWLLLLLCIAAIAGDSVNYWVGHLLRHRLAERGRIPGVKPEHLEKTHRFYEKYGAKTIVLARFVPIVRTLAPFVAGVGEMSYRRFMAYNVVGGVAWVVLCTLAGYFFGNLPFVRENFSLVILAIIFLSLVPAAVEILRVRREKHKLTAADISD